MANRYTGSSLGIDPDTDAVYELGKQMLDGLLDHAARYAMIHCWLAYAVATEADERSHTLVGQMAVVVSRLRFMSDECVNLINDMAQELMSDVDPPAEATVEPAPKGTVN